MAFNSVAFAVFLSSILAAYWLLRGSKRAQNLLLLAGSYLFYGYWDWRFLSLLVLSTVVDYFIALRLMSLRSPREKGRAMPWVMASAVANLGILGFFKYFNFFADSFAQVATRFGLHATPLFLDIILPVGISFYTFQTLSYTIDVYRGEMDATRRLDDFALYVAFFPQLVAGPIERARTFLPQITGARTFERTQFADGVNLIFWGLFKKIYVADNLAPFVNDVFASPAPSGVQVVAAVYAFAFQIYCDFSGYSDIARGCAKCLGMELMVNFRSPYIAVNPSDFWRRWHISLSTWLRDYLYISLGGSRFGTLITLRNLALTMLLGGLWHGATWLFVLWGAYQGGLLVAHRAWVSWSSQFKIDILPEQLARVFKIVAMFQFVCLGWLIFRAESVQQIGVMLSAVVSATGDVTPETLNPFIQFVLPLVLIEAVLGWNRSPGVHRLVWAPAYVRAGVYGVLFYLLAFHAASAQTFIYFQF